MSLRSLLIIIMKKMPITGQDEVADGGDGNGNQVTDDGDKVIHKVASDNNGHNVTDDMMLSLKRSLKMKMRSLRSILMIVVIFSLMMMMLSRSLLTSAMTSLMTSCWCCCCRLSSDR